MRTDILCISVLRVASGPRMKLAGHKSAVPTSPACHPTPPSPMVYSTDRSKAVVPVFVLLFVALWFSQRGNLFSVLPCVILSLYFSVLSIEITSLREERTNLSAFRTFVRFALVWFCLFPVPLRVWVGLRPMIVALAGLLPFFMHINNKKYMIRYDHLFAITTISVETDKPGLTV